MPADPTPQPTRVSGAVRTGPDTGVTDAGSQPGHVGGAGGGGAGSQPGHVGGAVTGGAVVGGDSGTADAGSQPGHLGGAGGDGGMRLRGVMSDREAWTAVGGCSVGRALDVVGTRSAMLLMREAFYGTTRFDDFAKRVGITEAVASARLKELVGEGLLVRSPYREPGRRTRYEYRLTEKGRDLLPAALALMQWGDRYRADVEGGPVQVTHAGCGAEVHAEVRCTEGHEVTLDDLTAGFRRPTASQLGSGKTRPA